MAGAAEADTVLVVHPGIRRARTVKDALKKLVGAVRVARRNRAVDDICSDAQRVNWVVVVGVGPRRATVTLGIARSRNEWQ
jgi:hypothetical protein